MAPVYDLIRQTVDAREAMGANLAVAAGCSTDWIQLPLLPHVSL